VDDVARHQLAQRCQLLPHHANKVHPLAPDLTREITESLAELERMRDAMGEERMAHDLRRQTLRRASAWAALVLQQESVFLASYFAPADPQAESFAPAAALNAAMSTHHRRVTRLDALRQAYRVNSELPDAEERVHLLNAASTRLFRALTESHGTELEPQPLAEARQRFDRGYVALRDSSRALALLTTEGMITCFPDLSPLWRRGDLER